MNTKHWKVSTVVVNNAPNEYHITTGKWGQPSIAVVADESNAAYICKAVNSHEALVKALREAKAAILSAEELLGASDMSTDAIAHAREALELAEGAI